MYPFPSRVETTDRRLEGVGLSLAGSRTEESCLCLKSERRETVLDALSFSQSPREQEEGHLTSWTEREEAKMNADVGDLVRKVEYRMPRGGVIYICCSHSLSVTHS